MTAKPGPGDRREGETDPAYQAFRAYVEMGAARSLTKVAAELHKSKTLLGRWSKRHRWQERARELDSRDARAVDDARLDVVRRRSRRQAEIAQLHGEATALVGMEVVRRITAAQRAGKDPFRDVKTDTLLALEATLARAHNRAVLTERLALGLTTDQPGEALPRSAAEEVAARLTDAELEQRLTGVDEVAEAREKRQRRAAG